MMDSGMYLNYRLVLLLGLLHHLCGHVGGQDILLVVSVHIHQNVRGRLPDPETIEIDSKLKNIGNSRKNIYARTTPSTVQRRSQKGIGNAGPK